jgi:flagellar hook-associated protein 2
LGVQLSISSPGIGSSLDVEGIVSKLMSVEQQPLTLLDQKTSAAQTKLNAMGAVSSALDTFKSALSSMSSASTFRNLTATAADSSVMTASASGTAVAGTYRVNVTQLAQSQSLSSAGRSGLTTAIGLGNSTTVTFQLGSVGGGSFGLTGGGIKASMTSAGLAGGSLVLNGTAIATDSTTRSAKDLAAAINAKSDATGVRASAAATSTDPTLFASFGTVDTSGGGSYALSVGGVSIASADAGATLDAAGLDTALGTAGVKSALAAAGISIAGSATGNDLHFTAADGSNISVAEAVSGTVTGGIGKATGGGNTGSSTIASSTVSLVSSDGSPITTGGSNPAAAGLTAGTGGAYLGGSFTQDANQTSGSIVIDSKNNSLQGIRDAINKASLGVTATIVSDGSANPYHLVLTSTKTGAKSSMKISVSATDTGGTPDADIASMLGYDPAGAQGMQQTTAAQSTQLSVNGIAVSSETNTVSEAIQGVTLNVNTVGKTNVTVNNDTAALKANLNSFVKAYNDLNTTIKGVSSYNDATKTAGPLFGDTTIRSLQTSLRNQFTAGLTGLNGGLTQLSQVGIAFTKDGTLALDSSKLDTAMKSNLNDIAGLFAVVGSSTDSLVSFEGSSTTTKPGDYPVHVTRLATQGTIAGDALSPATTTIIPGTKWRVTLDQFNDNVSSSRVATVELPAGSYSPAQLATAVQSAINGVSSFAGNGSSVSATVNGNGGLSVASNKYGSLSNIQIEAVAGTAPVFGTAKPLTGIDVAGTINGEAATGVGQLLTASGGDADGLQVKITGGSVPADRGSVGFSQGYAYQLTKLAGNYVGTDGLLQDRKDGFNATIKDIDKQRQLMNTRLADTEKRYRAQYTALDMSISSMQTTSTYLTQQLARLA